MATWSAGRCPSPMRKLQQWRWPRGDSVTTTSQTRLPISTDLLPVCLISTRIPFRAQGVGMSDKWDGVQWESGPGDFDREATIDLREPRRDRVAPNPPPKKVGRVDAKTIASIAVSDLIDCGSWKTAAVMRFYIDTANRLNGNCWPSEETVARKLGLRNTKVVSRANRWWRGYGYTVGNKLMPFLRLARRGRRRPDGTKEEQRLSCCCL